MPREIITLQCGECKERNYSTTKNRKTTTERLEFKKFCRRCNSSGLVVSDRWPEELTTSH